PWNCWIMPCPSGKRYLRDCRSSVATGEDEEMRSDAIANRETVGEPSEEVLLASAARFRIDGGEEDAANVLLSCSLGYWESGDEWWVGDERHHAIHVKLTGPRAAYDILTKDEHPITKAVSRAISAVLPDATYIKHFTVHMERIAIDPGWRQEL